MTRVYIILSLVLTAAAVASSLVVYPQLPERIPIHWNIHGQVDGYGGPGWIFLTPAIMAGMLLLFAILPWLSPKHFELDTFRATYWYIVLVLMGLFVYLHGLLTWAALAGKVDITRAMLSGMLIMFGLLGNVLGKVRRNFYVGVRTPWTLASERVWNDTHRLAGRMFVGAAVLGLPAVLLAPLEAAVVTVLVVIFTAALVPVGYSLVLYKRLERRGEINGEGKLAS